MVLCRFESRGDTGDPDGITRSQSGVLVPNVPDEIREEMPVEDDRRERSQKRVDERQSTDEESGNDDVAQQSTQNSDVTQVEDGVLVGEDDPRIAQTASSSGPRACVQTGDEEVIEVDTHAEDDGVGNEEPHRIPAVHGQDDDECDSSRDNEVVLRVDNLSPNELSSTEGLKLCVIEEQC